MATPVEIQTVQLSPAAAEIVRGLLKDRNLDSSYGLRVYVAGRTCSGLQYGMALDNKPGETDRTATFERLPGTEGDPMARVWEEEWKKDLLERGLAKVRARIADEKQYQVFDLYALQGWPARKVARSLGVSLARVYFCKHHVSRLLGKEIQRIQKRVG